MAGSSGFQAACDPLMAPSGASKVGMSLAVGGHVCVSGVVSWALLGQF